MKVLLRDPGLVTPEQISGQSRVQDVFGRSMTEEAFSIRTLPRLLVVNS